VGPGAVALVIWTAGIGSRGITATFVRSLHRGNVWATAVRKIMETGAVAAPTASVRFTYSTDLGSADRGGHSARVR
jgi:hypothetical protein